MASLNLFVLCATVFLNSYVQSQPAIAVDGNDMTVTLAQGGTVSVNAGADRVQLYPAPIDPSITSDVAKLQTQVNDLQATVDKLLAAQKILQTTATDNAANISNVSGFMVANLNKIETVDKAQGETRFALDELAEDVLDLFKATNSSQEGLDTLSSLVSKVRHPETQDVYGLYVLGDDRISSATCRDGLTLTRCSVELRPDSTGYRIDGSKYNTTTQCLVRASGSGDAIRAKAECSNLHTDTVIARHPADDTFFQGNVRAYVLSCPDGYRALACACISAWSFCRNDGFGFSPSSSSTCQVTDASVNAPPTRPDMGIQLTALCVKNA